MVENRVRPARAALMYTAGVNPDLADLYRWQGQMATVMGRPQEVVRCIIELIKRNAFNKEDLILVTSANPVAPDGSRLAKMIELDPESRFDILAYVLNDIALNHLDKARNGLKEITRARPQDAEAMGLLGEILADGPAPDFLAWNAQVTPALETNSHVWLARGKWLRHQGHTDSAIRCLYEAFQREPELQPANFLLGQLLTQTGATELGSEFTVRGKRLQTIISLSARLRDQRANDWLTPLIAELQATGRLWEAWGWIRILEQLPPADRKLLLTAEIQALKSDLDSRLTASLPRTHPDSLPGRDFEWQQFPLPDWSKTAAVHASPAHSSEPRDDSPPQKVTRPAEPIRFVDQGSASGLNFRYVTAGSPQQGRKIFETMGAGVGVLDYDLDEWPDLYFPQGSTSATEPSIGPTDALYRNRFGEQFVDVTPLAGIHETAFSQGVACGDFDCDGFPDVYVANLGRNTLYHNNGDGTFTDVTSLAGLRQSVWTVSCAIADLNGDGLPELFDVNYVGGAKLFTGMCYDQHNRPGICRPVVYDPVTDTIGLNQGDGRFIEQQRECGLELPQGTGLGLVVADFNDDGRVDVFVANDMTPNYLLINDQTSPDQPLHFRDEAFLRGVALDQNGASQACMGVACADVNRDGAMDLYITNFAREHNAFYRSQPGGFYQDQIRSAGLSEPGFEPLGFGTQFFDADHDGWYDLVLVNGQIDKIPGEPYRMRAQFFRGTAAGTFTELFADQAEGIFRQERLGRGLALLDWNRDGKIDFVASDLEAAVLLAENQTISPGHAVQLKLIGTRSNRDAVGAKLRIRVSADDIRTTQIMAGDGYESSSQKGIDIGIGSRTIVEEIQIQWPSGHIDTKTNVDTKSPWIAIEGTETWFPVIRD
ncbi:FG-GAP-like repeat-containing protein [Schlesneria sp. T3-172]|uniref:FG-GAP-like repeat-containing protein n=1 Tax=Schlesneria sphaerica TaxID=3373610 RepID=UPI0037C6296C